MKSLLLSLVLVCVMSISYAVSYQNISCVFIYYPKLSQQLPLYLEILQLSTKNSLVPCLWMFIMSAYSKNGGKALSFTPVYLSAKELDVI